MNLEIHDRSRIPFALRALKTVATARAPMHPTQRTMLGLGQELIAQSALDLDALPPISPEELAAEVHAKEGAERVVRAMVLVCMARGEVSPEDVTLIDRYASALGVEEHALVNLHRLAEGQHALLRYDVNRRSFTGQAIAQAREEEGLLSLLKAAGARIGLLEDAETAARYDALAGYPAHSLGAELHAYYQRNHFPVPGRKHAIPALATVHDLCHVLSGYGVDGEGEIEVVAFQAGFMKTDPMSTIFFIVLQAHMNVQLVKIAPGQKGALDDPKMLERMMRAFLRGKHVKRDLFDHWDYWPELTRDIDEVRAELGVGAAS